MTRLALWASLLLACVVGTAQAQDPTGTNTNPSGSVVIGTTPITGGSTGNCLYDNAGRVGEQACGGAPSGAAGGDLTGTYPNPTIKASVSLTTPVLGVATGTSLALGGCAIGSNAFCATGTANFNGTVSIATSGNLLTVAGGAFINGGTLTVAGNVTIQAGNFFRSNTMLPTADSTTAIQIYKANASTVVMNFDTTNNAVNTAGSMLNTGITTDATHTDSAVCQDTTTHQFYSGSGAAGICLGTSGRQFKRDFAPMTAGLAEVMQLPLQSYRYRDGFGDNGARRQYGLVAQDVEAVLPELVGHDANGETINYDVGALWFIALKAIQELNDKVETMNRAWRIESSKP